MHRGLIVHEATFGDSLATALVGGLVGLFLLVAAVFVFVLLRYRLIGDRTWRVSWEMIYRETGSVVSSGSSVRMECKVTPPVLLSALGHVEAVVRYPDGTLLERGQEAMGSTEYGIGFAPTGGARPQTGTYEIRWYGTSGTRRLREITRSRYTFHG